MIKWIKIEDEKPIDLKSVFLANEEEWCIGYKYYESDEYDESGEFPINFIPTHWAHLSDFNLPAKSTQP